jgi:hypothetical protein
MLHFQQLRWLALVPALGLAVSAAGQVPRSPYYSARPGTAQLTDARQLKGKFYYHEDPLSEAVSFYYYPKGTASQQVIPATRISTLTISSRRDTAKHYVFHQRQGKLFLGTPAAKQQELTRELFVGL